VPAQAGNEEGWKREPKALDARDAFVEAAADDGEREESDADNEGDRRDKLRNRPKHLVECISESANGRADVAPALQRFEACCASYYIR
jgi:hypothetical protein